MPQSPHRRRNDPKCVEWDVKPCSIQSKAHRHYSIVVSFSEMWTDLRYLICVTCAGWVVDVYKWSVVPAVAPATQPQSLSAVIPDRC